MATRPPSTLGTASRVFYGHTYRVPDMPPQLLLYLVTGVWPGGLALRAGEEGAVTCATWRLVPRDGASSAVVRGTL